MEVPRSRNVRVVGDATRLEVVGFVGDWGGQLIYPVGGLYCVFVNVYSAFLDECRGGGRVDLYRDGVDLVFGLFRGKNVGVIGATYVGS